MTSNYHLSIKNQLPELSRVQVSIERFFQTHELPVEMAGEMMLVAEELLANTICYGYTDEAEHSIDIEMNLNEEEFSVTLVDDAKAFNPLQQQPPVLGLPATDSAVGGLGIPLIRALSDQQHYQRRNNQNVFIFTKQLPSAS